MTKYYDTLQRKKSQKGKEGYTLLVYISNKWPIPTYTKVWFTIRGINEDIKDETRVKKILRRSGTGRKITCNKVWGYKEGDWVVITVEPVNAPTELCELIEDDLSDDEDLEDGDSDQETD